MKAKKLNLDIASNAINQEHTCFSINNYKAIQLLDYLGCIHPSEFLIQQMESLIVLEKREIGERRDLH